MASVIKSVSLSEEQLEFVEENGYSLSKLLQNKVQEKINEKKQACS